MYRTITGRDLSVFSFTQFVDAISEFALIEEFSWKRGNFEIILDNDCRMKSEEIEDILILCAIPPTHGVHYSMLPR